jgi:hypothetical protein
MKKKGEQGMRARGAWRGKSLSLRNIRQVESEFGGIRAVNMVALLKSEPVRRTASIKSELYSELVVFKKKDFLECLAIHPSAAAGVYSVMREKIDGYTGDNRRSILRSVSYEVQKKLSEVDDENEKNRRHSYVNGLSSISTPSKTPDTTTDGNNFGGVTKNAATSVSSPTSKLDSMMNLEQFLDNRSAQFGISKMNLIEFAKVYSNKLHNKQYRDAALNNELNYK